jgi:hypothetical protein
MLPRHNLRFALVLSSVLAAPLARAEIVIVSDAGELDLSSFDCIDVVESRLLKRVCYDQAQQYLVAEIHGRYYDQCRVAPALFDEFLDSETPVAFYNQRIRAGHKCSAAQRPKYAAGRSSETTGASPSR